MRRFNFSFQGFTISGTQSARLFNSFLCLKLFIQLKYILDSCLSYNLQGWTIFTWFDLSSFTLISSIHLEKILVYSTVYHNQVTIKRSSPCNWFGLFFGDLKNRVETSQRLRQGNNQLIVVGTDGQQQCRTWTQVLQVWFPNTYRGGNKL